MAVHVVTEQVAQVRWLRFGQDEMVFVLPEELVTREGADALQDCWAHFIGRGLWAPAPTHRDPGRPMIRARYTLSDRLGPDTPAVVRSRWHIVVGVLSSAHFQPSLVPSLNAAVAECIAACRWEYCGRMRASA